MHLIFSQIHPGHIDLSEMPRNRRGNDASSATVDKLYPELRHTKGRPLLRGGCPGCNGDLSEIFEKLGTSDDEAFYMITRFISRFT